jgi:glycosyltransferase involved in cell wall biosynthesis
MVGTLEPRKRHAQVLDAFELLWEQGLEVELHIVGRRGWLVDQLIERLTQHPRSGQQLVWREDASDEELAEGYASSSALISASAGEGFGLPLIEAARYGLPIIARDLPVFREILGENAFYFSGNEAHDLAQALEQWLLAESRGDTITPHAIEFQSWPDSAAQILQELRRLSGYGEEGILEITTTNVSGTNGETPR